MNLNQGYYYTHHYGHVYATHYGGHEGMSCYSEDGCPPNQSWSWNSGTVVSCTPEFAPECQWAQPPRLFQQASEQVFHTETVNWS